MFRLAIAAMTAAAPAAAYPNFEACIAAHADLSKIAASVAALELSFETPARVSRFGRSSPAAAETLTMLQTARAAMQAAKEKHAEFCREIPSQ